VLHGWTTAKEFADLFAYRGGARARLDAATLVGGRPPAGSGALVVSLAFLPAVSLLIYGAGRIWTGGAARSGTAAVEAGFVPISRRTGAGRRPRTAAR